MNKRLILLLAIFPLAAMVLSACGTPPANNWPGLSAEADKAYLAAGTYVYAVDLADGSEVWRYPTEANNKRQFFTAPILTPDGQLLISSAGSEHVFLSLDPLTGKEKWPAPFLGAKGTWVAAPLVFNDLIFAPNSDGALYILDLQGDLVESVRLGGSLWSQPVSDGSYIYVASLDHHLHVIDPSSFDILQSVDLGGAIPGGPVSNTDGVYVGSFTGKLEFVSSTGTQRTLAETKNWIWGPPSLDGETLYFADLGGRVYSLDLASNRQNWGELQPDGPVAASPLVLGDAIIVVTESGSVYAFDPNGNQVWTRPYAAGGKIYTSPVSAAGLILVAPFRAESLLLALDSQGRLVWDFPPKE